MEAHTHTTFHPCRPSSSQNKTNNLSNDLKCSLCNKTDSFHDWSMTPLKVVRYSFFWSLTSEDHTLKDCVSFHQVSTVVLYSVIATTYSAFSTLGVCPVKSVVYSDIRQSVSRSDDQGYHLITCKLGGGPSWTRESMKSRWSQCLRELQLSHRQEPVHQYSDNEKRETQHHSFDRGSGSKVELDVSLAHPLLKASTEAGYTETREKTKKDDKYGNELRLGPITPSFVPLVQEHVDRWGEKAEKYVNLLVKHSRDEEDCANTAALKILWRQRFSVLLQQCNAIMMMKKLLRISEEGGEDDSRYDGVVHNFFNV